MNSIAFILSFFIYFHEEIMNLNRECVTMAELYRRSLERYNLHPLILKLLVLGAPAVLGPRVLSRMHQHPQIQIPNAFPA